MTARFFTGAPFSVTDTSSVVRAGFLASGNVRMYARSGKIGLPASTTSGLVLLGRRCGDRE